MLKIVVYILQEMFGYARHYVENVRKIWSNLRLISIIKIQSKNLNDDKCSEHKFRQNTDICTIMAQCNHACNFRSVIIAR